MLKSECETFVILTRTTLTIPSRAEYYLNNQLSNPLTRIFEPIIPNPQVIILEIRHDHSDISCLIIITIR